MCPPDEFNIDYEINPWMSVNNNVDKAKAKKQWEDLRDAYLSRGISVEIIKPTAGLPDMVFTANGALVAEDVVILSHFRYKERQGEEQYFKQWFDARGYKVIELEDGVTFEGQGEALRMGQRIFHGFGFRSNQAASEMIAKYTKLNVIPLNLTDARFYHLDTCFCPINEEIVLYFPAAFTSQSESEIRKNFPKALAVSETAAKSFACNVVVIGSEIFMPKGNDAEVGKILGDLGYSMKYFDMSEFMKSGGGVRCLTLTLN